VDVLSLSVWFLECVASALGWLGAACYSGSQAALRLTVRLLDRRIAYLKHQKEVTGQELELIKGGKN
jgi:hypothetical protein